VIPSKASAGGYSGQGGYNKTGGFGGSASRHSRNSAVDEDDDLGIDGLLDNLEKNKGLERTNPEPLNK
jgi:hypothetical protein